MKVGANSADIIKIGKLAKKGKKAGEISKILAIKKEVIESFMPKKPEKK
jgi:hypothetical protein